MHTKIGLLCFFVLFLWCSTSISSAASTNKNQASSKNAELITAIRSQVNAPLQSTVYLYCITKAKKSVKYNVTWTKEDEILTGDQRREISHKYHSSMSVAVLKISNVTEDDYSTYNCTAKHTSGIHTKLIQITASKNDENQNSSSIPREFRVEAPVNSTVFLYCEENGSQFSQNTVWSKGNQSLENDGHYKNHTLTTGIGSESLSVLEITSVSTSDYDIYNCKSNFDSGESYKTSIQLAQIGTNSSSRSVSMHNLVFIQLIGFLISIVYSLH